MRVEVVAIGNELLNGDLADGHTRRFGAWLRARGLSLSWSQVVPDTKEAIIASLTAASARADLVLVSGGLGPTEDDITIASFADLIGADLETDQATLDTLRARFASRGYPFTENNARQALVPVGATLLNNPVGTAPGIRGTHNEATFFFFPGVTHELKRLMDDHLEPWVAEHAGARAYESVVLKTFGQTESKVATLLEPLARPPGLHVAFRATFPEIHVSFHVTDRTPEHAAEILTQAKRDALERLGPLVFAHDKATSFVDAVAATLTERGATLATAESCTGGLVAKLCTDRPGSSQFFAEGAVTYSNAAKTRQLGVPAELMASHGAVSEPVARAMAEGIRGASGATFGVAITGVAGPGGGSEAKPVGTIHFALAGPDGTQHKMRRMPFDRERNRIVAAYLALDLVRQAALGTASD